MYIRDIGGDTMRETIVAIILLSLVAGLAIGADVLSLSRSDDTVRIDTSTRDVYKTLNVSTTAETTEMRCTIDICSFAMYSIQTVGNSTQRFGMGNHQIPARECTSYIEVPITEYENETVCGSYYVFTEQELLTSKRTKMEQFLTDYALVLDNRAIAREVKLDRGYIIIAERLQP